MKYESALEASKKPRIEPLALSNMVSIEDRMRDIFTQRKVPVKRGCLAAKMGGCFCSGKCNEIVGYRDKLPDEL
jgi:hypothetical protein